MDTRTTKERRSPPCPAIPKDVLEWLERTVPERCPDPQQKGRDIWIYAGKRSLVRALRAEYDRQNTPTREGMK